MNPSSELHNNKISYVPECLLHVLSLYSDQYTIELVKVNIRAHAYESNGINLHKTILLQNTFIFNFIIMFSLQYTYIEESNLYINSIKCKQMGVNE